MLRLAVAVGLLVLAAAVSARAEDRVARGVDVDRVAFNGGELAYERLSWRVDAADAVFYSTGLVAQRPGGRARKIADLAGATDWDGENNVTVAEWGMSDSSLLIGRTDISYMAGGPVAGTYIRGGPVAGSRPRLSRCYDFGELAPSVAVAGDHGAYDDICHNRVVVRRLDQPRAEPELVLPDDGGAVDLTASKLGVLTEGAIRVFERPAGTELLRVRGKFRNTFWDAAFDMQDDGKVAARLYGGGCSVAWYSPAEPRPHVLGETDCDADVRIDGDRIAWMRPRGKRAELVVSDLEGHDGVVARFPAGTVGPHVAFDSGRLAYAVGRCDGTDTLLLRTGVDGPVWPDRDPVRCPGKVTDRSLRVPVKGDTVRVPMRCPRGCSGYFELPAYDFIDQPFRVRRHAHAARLHLDRGTLDELSRHGSATLRLKLAFADRTGSSGQGRALTLHLRRAR
jgi:hypothetical protein